MTKEEKQLLLKDLCARLLYGVIINCSNNDTNYKCFLHTDILHEIQNGYEYYDYKPFLRPMSSMTEKEKLDYVALGNILRYGKPQYAYLISEQLDYLNANHFDYRGLIEKGLALEAPEGMYKTE